MYRNLRVQQHIPYQEGNYPIGTTRYISINTHLGVEPSRRDDLEALGYVLLNFVRGNPWKDLREGRQILKAKASTSVEEQTRGLPIEFAKYINYCRKLKFEAHPNYAYLKLMFKDLFIREGFNLVFDWTELKLAKVLEGKKLRLKVRKWLKSLQSCHKHSSPIFIHSR